LRIVSPRIHTQYQLAPPNFNEHIGRDQQPFL
jgi:hypothetical protein